MDILLDFGCVGMDSAGDGEERMEREIFGSLEKASTIRDT